MHIVIPTYKRLNDQKTWNTLAPELRKHVTFYRLDYLRKRRKELGLPDLQDKCRVPEDFYLYEETCEDWRDEGK